MGGEGGAENRISRVTLLFVKVKIFEDFPVEETHEQTLSVECGLADALGPALSLMEEQNLWAKLSPRISAVCFLWALTF